MHVIMLPGEEKGWEVVDSPVAGLLKMGRSFSIVRMPAVVSCQSLLSLRTVMSVSAVYKKVCIWGKAMTKSLCKLELL